MKSWQLKTISIFTVLSAMLLYLPVNRIVSGGYNLELPIDGLIPIVPIFVLPYLFAIIFWISVVIFVNSKESEKRSKIFNLKVILAGVISVMIYMIIPTYVTRPQITSTDFFSDLLNLVYSNDRAYNAAPSGHTFFTVICMLTLNKLFPKFKTVWFALSILIIASTLFTKQHNFLDVILGIVFALVINFSVEKYYKDRKSV